MLPFSADVFHALTAQYHAAVWPAHLVGLLLTAGLVTAALRGRPSARILLAVTALPWLWTGGVFHGLFFSTISFFAPVAAGLFIVQAGALLWVSRRPSPAPLDVIGWAGIALMGLAVAGAPLFGRLSGLTWAEVPLAGTGPIPLAAFTLGLLLTLARPPLLVALIPSVWLAASAWAAWVLGDTASLWPAVIGLLGLPILVVRHLRA